MAAAGLVVVACAGGAPPAQAPDARAGLHVPSPGFGLPRGKDVAVIRYVVSGKTYYYVRSPCCDLANRLYDEQGHYVCAPDGGFAGRGDGKCGALRLDPKAGVVVPNPFAKSDD